MRIARRTLIALTLAALLSWDATALAQYGGNRNTGNTGTAGNNTRSGGSGDRQGNLNPTTPTDRRRRTAGTSAEEETAEEREARRDKGLEAGLQRGAPPGIAKDGPQVVGEVDEGAWGKLTDEQQAAAVAELKKFGEDTRAKVNSNLVLNETKYFLFYSDLKSAEATKWSSMLDRMYLKLAGLFGIKDGENLFRGKALVFVFAREEDYQNFQKTMHEFDAAGTAGLCHAFGNGDVHIGFFRQPNEADFAAVLVHESVHGFLHRYKKPPSIPTWANEGLAETIASELVPQKGKRQEYRQNAIAIVRERGSLGTDFFTGNRLEDWQYPVAHMLTEFMIKQSKKNYVAFIDGMKDGMKWEDALAQRYGAPRERLVAAFAETYNIRGLGGPNQQPDPRRVQEPNRDREEEERRRDRE